MTEIYNPIGVDVTTPSPTPLSRVGTRAFGDNGSEWLYVQDSGAGVTGAGYVVFVTATFTATMISTSNDARGNILGVSPIAVPASNFYWIQRKGTANVQVAASCAANALLDTTATAGQIDDDGTTGAFTVVGLVLTTARSATAGNAPAMLDNPIVGAVL